ncbi:MAG: PAS domain S-box protein [Nitrospirae bacterium]|nr:PAS domain S-box protein [Nitrospirota bacterium]
MNRAGMFSLSGYQSLPVLLGSLLAGTLLIGAIALSVMEHQLLETTGQSLAQGAGEVADDLDRIIFERRGDIQMMARAFTGRCHDSAYISAYLHGMSQAYPLYESLSMINEQGLVLATTHAGGAPIDFSRQPWFALLRDGHVTGVQQWESTQQAGQEVGAGVFFAAAITDDQGRFCGAVLSRVGLALLSEVVTGKREALNIHTTSYASLEYQFATSEGLAFVDSLHQGDEEPANLRALAVPSFLRAEFHGMNFLEEQHPRRQVPVLTGFARTQGYWDSVNPNWTVLLRKDRSTLLAPIRSRMAIVAAFGLLGLLPITLGLLWTVRRLQYSDQELRESEQRFQTLFEQAAVGVAQVETATGRFVRINHKYCEIAGYSQAEMLVMEDRQLMCPEDRATCLDKMRRLAAGEILEFELEQRYLRRDGMVAWVKLTVSPMWVPGEKPDYHIAVVQDITQHKQAETALQTFQEQVRQTQKMEALGQLASGVAHDFNNILSAILGNAEMACAKMASDHVSRKNLMRILEASGQGSRLVEQILTFARQGACRRTVIALAPVVQEVIGLLQATLPAGIELTLSSDAATPLVLADAMQIHQVVMNLCRNAQQALGDQAGSILVSLAPVTLTQRLRTFDGTLPPGRYARLSVRDTGCGMDSDTMTRMFDPFFTTKLQGQGTGLGLSVVQGIVQAYGGAIVVESHPGQGATLALYFPAAEAPTVTASLPRQDRIRHLLYLDDEAVVAQVRVQLEPLGYRVTGCTLAAEALDAVRADPALFDVVVTDYNRPGQSGLEVARALSEIRVDLPIVLVSDYLTPSVQAAAFAAGVTEIVHKPTLLRQLGSVVNRLTNRP